MNAVLAANRNDIAPKGVRFIVRLHCYKHRTPGGVANKRSLRLSGSPKQLTKEARLWRVRSKRLFGA